MENRYFKKEDGLFVLRRESIVDTIVTKEIHLGINDSIDNYTEVSENDGNNLIEIIDIKKKELKNEDKLSDKINNYDLSDNTSLMIKEEYPKWNDFIGKSLSVGFKVYHNENLWKVRQEIPVVLEGQEPSITTAALYEVINETHEGTLEDPIPFVVPMEIFNGKYYIEDGIKYKCTRDSGIPLNNKLSELVGIYVEKV